MGEFSITHILIVLGLYIIFFGHKKLPEFGKGLGGAIRDFKKAMNTDEPEKPREQMAKPADPLLKEQKEEDVSQNRKV